VSRRRNANAAWLWPARPVWNVSSVVLAGAAGLLLAAGSNVAGREAFLPRAGGYAARSAMRG